MKILFLNHNLIGRGTYFRCLVFARQLAKSGHQVEIWTTSDRVNIKGRHRIEDGVSIWTTPRWGAVGRHDGGYAPVDIACRTAGILGKPWDIIHAFDHRPNVIAPWCLQKLIHRILRKRSTLFISDWCDWWTAGGITTGRRAFVCIDKIEQIVEEGSKRVSDGVSVISNVLLKRGLDLGIPREKIIRLPTGIDPARFPVFDRHVCRTLLNLPIQPPILGFVGFSFWDLEWLAKAFHIVHSRFPEVKLLIVGGGVEETSKDIIRTMFKVNEEVFLPGVVSYSDIPLYLGACDFHLMPMQNTLANQARIPNKLFDYFASGRAVVSTNVGDAAEWIIQRKLGLVSSPTPHDFADKCIILLQNNEYSQKCGKNSRVFAENEFNISTLSNQLVQFYETIKLSTFSC